MAIRKPFLLRPLDLGTVATDSQSAGYPATNVKRLKAPGLVWRTTPISYIRGDFGLAREVDFLSIVSATALAGTQYRLRLGATQAAVDGAADYDSGALALISPSIVREDGLYHSHFELPSLQTRRWWRIDFSGHTGTLDVGGIVLGKRIDSLTFYNPEFERGARDLGSLQFSRWGVADEEPGVVLRTLAFTLGWASEAQYEASLRPLGEAVGVRAPVFVCFDPDATTYRQAKTYMGVLTRPLVAKGLRKPATYAIDFEMISLI